MSWRRWLAIGLCCLAAAGPVRALGPKDVFILVNKNVAGSRQVARKQARLTPHAEHNKKPAFR